MRGEMRASPESSLSAIPYSWAEKPPAKKNPKVIACLSKLAFLTRTDNPLTTVIHSAENDHLVRYNPETEIFEVHYQSSADVRAILELNMLGRDKWSHLEAARPHEPRKLAFIDVQGSFIDQATLVDLETNIKVNGKTTIKHTAVFDYASGGAIETRAIPIDDIYCISLAVPEQPAS